jgi:hypothetical protein
MAAHPPDLHDRPLMDMDFAMACPLVRLARADAMSSLPSCAHKCLDPTDSEYLRRPSRSARGSQRINWPIGGLDRLTFSHATVSV